jgi:hypothetical protein
VTTAIQGNCLALEVLRNYDCWLGTPSPTGLQALLIGAEDRAWFTEARIPEWTIWGPLNDPNFYLPIVALTGHPTLSIKWATAIELIHFSLRDAMTDLQNRLEAWSAGPPPKSDEGIRSSPPITPFRDHLANLVSRPAMYLGNRSAWLLYCYFLGLDRGGDWLRLPALPESREVIDRIESESSRHYGSRFGAYRVYEQDPAELLSWVGIAPHP